MRGSLSLLVVSLLAGCPAPIFIRLVEPATVDNLTFILSTREGGDRPASIGWFFVRPCREAHTSVESITYLWEIEGGGARTRELRYGSAPESFSVYVVAHPLELGECYWVNPGGANGLYVYFDSAGRGKEVTWQEAMEIEGLTTR